MGDNLQDDKNLEAQAAKPAGMGTGPHHPFFSLFVSATINVDQIEDFDKIDLKRFLEKLKDVVDALHEE